MLTMIIDQTYRYMIDQTIGFRVPNLGKPLVSGDLFDYLRIVYVPNNIDKLSFSSTGIAI